MLPAIEWQAYHLWSENGMIIYNFYLGDAETYYRFSDNMLRYQVILQRVAK